MRLLIHTLPPSGHLRPTIPIAQAWKKNGHEVVVAAERAAQAETEDFGLDFVALPSPDLGEGQEFRRELERMPEQQRAPAVALRFLRMAAFWTRPLTEAAEVWQPDVILREGSAWAAFFAGELVDVPVATFDFGGRPMQAFAESFGAGVANLRNELGLSPDPELVFLHRWLTLVGGPPEWFSPGSLAPTTHLIQPPDPEPPPGESIDWLLETLDDRPLVYATLGSTFNAAPGVWPMVLDGLATIDANVVATVGRDLLPVGFGPQPPNIRLESFISQALLLPHCSAVLAHGGYGSLMGALRHGVPVVSIPLAAADNRRNAAKMERLGAGIAIHEESRSSSAVAQAMTTVLTEPEYRDAARRLSASIAALPPVSHGAALLERLAHERQPILR